MPRNKTDSPQLLLTVRQAADIFQVEETTVRMWLRKHLLRGVKVGRGWRIKQAVVDDYLNR